VALLPLLLMMAAVSDPESSTAIGYPIWGMYLSTAADHTAAGSGAGHVSRI